MGENIYVFYGEGFYGKFTSSMYKALRITVSPAMYNSAYIHIETKHMGLLRTLEDHAWYRMDGIPVFLSDVPESYRNEFKTMILLNL